MRSLIAIVGVALASPAIAADQFDLVCQEEYRFRPNARWQKTETRYHFDLSENRWCGGDCRETRPLAEVTEGRLVLRRQERSIDNSIRVFDWIDRRTGEISGYTSSVGFPDPAFYERKGICRPEPFSGFPIPATQF